jgi:hypothetical protein
MDARQEREAQLSAGDLQASHRVSAATPHPATTMEDIGIAIATVLHSILDELERLNVTLERLADK